MTECDPELRAGADSCVVLSGKDSLEVIVRLDVSKQAYN